MQPSDDEIRAAILLDGAWVLASVIDISTTGVRLRLRTDTPPPATMTLALHLGGQELPAQGQLRWKNHSDGCLMLGVAFNNTQDGALAAAIGGWFRERIERQMPIRLAG